jgi:hypothetical protein
MRFEREAREERMFGWLDLEPIDIGAYMVCDILGMVLFFSLMPHLTLAIVASILFSFHLFLGWLVVNADHETGFSLPIAMTIFTHLCCLVIVILCSVIVLALSGAGRFVPIYIYLFLRPVRYILGLCIPALAIFERFWLFSGGGKKKVVVLTAEAVAAAAETAAVTDAVTVDDYQEWLGFVARQPKPFPKPGSTLKIEYERWLVARTRSRAASSSKNQMA